LAASAAEARTANSARGARRADARLATGWHLAAAKEGAWRSPREPGAAILGPPAAPLLPSAEDFESEGERDKMTLHRNGSAYMSLFYLRRCKYLSDT